ncbi:hypothetical protein WME99_01140 [Sorangium sp. So ce136]|uniref:hypothetical protein n=1 Tax=Sorangium sp. So ce136 TaxID=3133284 RepID=UPI003F120C87
MKTVLFACIHNAGRSQMAAAWFNALSDPSRARAISAWVRASRRDPVATGARIWLCRALVGACCAGALGCAKSSPPAPAPAAPAAASTAPAVSSAPGGALSSPGGALSAPPSAEPERAAEAPPREPWVGTLELTKGEQPMIAGRIMSREDAERWLGPDWRALRGQRVRVLAALRDHVCEPHAQCLQGGRIPLLEQVASVDLCNDAGRPEGVDCALSPAQSARCKAECRDLSDSCDQQGASDRGALRRCGCAKVTCEQGCDKTGEPWFACR